LPPIVARPDPKAEGARLAVRCILTKAAQEFITPLSAGALAGSAFTDLFDATTE
jgi:phosphopantothenoylcysteine decarboxylase/phosphopantothenate--cysteine ligase